MAHWNSRGLRGSSFEEIINFTNERYRQSGLALFQKIPTPITPVRMDEETRTITLAYFEKQSTVDYIGVAQGIPIAFDAKETAGKSLPLQNIHAHQVEFMRRFEAQQGVAFFLIHYTKRDVFYYLPFRDLLVFWERMEQGGRKSFRFEELKEQYFFSMGRGGVFVPYLQPLQIDLDARG